MDVDMDPSTSDQWNGSVPGTDEGRKLLQVTFYSISITLGLKSYFQSG